MASFSEPASIFLCAGSHTYVTYLPATRKLLARSLRLESVTIPAWSIFVDHGILQHAGSGLQGRSRLCYYVYLKTANLVL